MNPPPNSTLADRQQIIADLQRELANAQQELIERTAQRDEAVAQQAATAEVLAVINSSPGDLTPVFDAMLEKAMRLCEASFGAMWTFDSDRFVPLATYAVPAAYADFIAANTMLPGPGTAPYRFLRGGERSVIEDVNLLETEAYRVGDPQRRALLDIGGARSAIQVPLCRDVVVLGVMTLYQLFAW